MSGTGTANGAATIINAFATGRGAAFGIGLSVTATVEPAKEWIVEAGKKRLGPRDSQLAIHTARAVQRLWEKEAPLRIHVQSEIPQKKGLKSSSAVSVAVARATLDHLGRKLQPKQLLGVVGDASLSSHTSLTGAIDDAAACMLGGVVFTDNETRKIIAHDRLPGTLVALLHVPPTTLATGSLDRKRFAPLADLVEEAWELGRAGRYKEAMLANTLLYAPLLGHRPRFTLRALARGAYAAGLSGKGPAEVALVHRDEVETMLDVAAGCIQVELAQPP